MSDGDSLLMLNGFGNAAPCYRVQETPEKNNYLKIR
jgi:hypothetical protein